MKDLPLPVEFTSFLEGRGFVELFPPQAAAVESGLLDGKNLLVASPTASGKTLIAALAAFKRIVVQKRKVVYLSPLRALASEKYAEFKGLLEGFGVSCVISTGDFDSSGEALKAYDLLVLTNEKFDSLLRHGVSWLADVGLFVSDEVHLAGSGDRGPTLEMILTRVIHSGVDAQLLSLSATVSNAEEVARWLRSELVELTWRPVPLREGVYDRGRVWFADLQGEIETVRSSYGGAIDVAVDSIARGGQSLIFASTRRRAVSLAAKASELTSRHLGEAERRACADAARRIRESGEETSLSRLLADVVSKGAAFHHAGLPHEHRKLVEDAYRERAVKLLASTPTLAAGINLPARRVVVADLTRYDGERGMSSPISVMEYRQMAGRAGRPQYDEFGEAVIVPPPALGAEDAVRHYVESSPEPIESRLGGERGMRIHLLAVIASRMGISREEVDAIFSKTLLAAQAGRESVARHLDSALGYLFAEQLVVEKGGKFHATGFGKRVSTLYIDPITGVLFKKNMGGFEPGPDHTVRLLHLVAKSPDFEPRFPLREKYYAQAYEFLERNRGSVSPPGGGRTSFLEYEEALQEMRTVMVIDSWIDERKEDDILERLGAEPGDLHRAVDSADWLLYCLCELARLYGRQEVIKEAGFLRRRVEKGVRQELVELTRLKGVGRARARALYSSGYKTVKAVRDAPAEKLALVDKIGPTIAQRIKEEAA
ncbi:MAG: DEAD/DEAH box helicase [Nitrososphaerota archaeon]|nr:DEAD/DEAH box helicase [Nitrososphaerota archaeon]MDG6979064.1 DEAD/DEAH box helicase [Nitrososphaerota archaeon]MDG7021882.1 DEAD/DEAH box helicase [Nitrososphaerota archaeon]